MRNFDIKGNGDKKKQYDGVTKNKPIGSDWAYNSPSNKRMNKMVSNLKKPLVTDAEGKNLKKNIMKSGSQEAIGGTVIKGEQITRMQFDMDDEKYMKLQKNRQFNEYARKNKLIPEFKDSDEMVKFYSDKSKVNKLNQQQKEYFKKNKWDMVERDIEGNRTKKYPSYKGPIK